MSFSSLTNITQKQAKAVLLAVNDVSDISPFNEAQTSIMAEDLSFYPDVKHCVLMDDSSLPVTEFSCLFSTKTNDFNPCGHTMDWVIAMNNHYGLLLSEETIADYIRFALEHTQLKGGKMICLRSIEDMPWRDEPPAEARSGLASLLTPFMIDDSDPENGYVVVFSGLYADSIFTVNASVSQQGQLTINSTDEVAADLPVFSHIYAI